jgi:hypothetical protein
MEFVYRATCLFKKSCSYLSSSLYIYSWNETSLRQDQRTIEKYFVEGNSSLNFTHDIFITVPLCVCVCVCVYVCMYVCGSVLYCIVLLCMYVMWAWGGVVVKALRY